MPDLGAKTTRALKRIAPSIRSLVKTGDLAVPVKYRRCLPSQTWDESKGYTVSSYKDGWYKAIKTKYDKGSAPIPDSVGPGIQETNTVFLFLGTIFDWPNPEKVGSGDLIVEGGYYKTEIVETIDSETGETISEEVSTLIPEVTHYVTGLSRLPAGLGFAVFVRK